MNKYLQSTRMILLVLLPFILLMGCATSSESKSLELALSQYEKIVRWSQWDAAVDFLAPEFLEQRPITRLDLDRLRLFRVTQYSVRSSLPYADGMGLQQNVEIRLFNKSRAVERSIIDRQDWRYDSERQRWSLHSGLPDVTQAR